MRFFKPYQPLTFQTSSSTISLEGLHKDLLLDILNILSFEDVINLLKVSKNLYMTISRLPYANQLSSEQGKPLIECALLRRKQIELNIETIQELEHQLQKNNDHHLHSYERKKCIEDFQYLYIVSALILSTITGTVSCIFLVGLLGYHTSGLTKAAIASSTATAFLVISAALTEKFKSKCQISIEFDLEKNANLQSEIDNLKKDCSQLRRF